MEISSSTIIDIGVKRNSNGFRPKLAVGSPANCNPKTVVNNRSVAVLNTQHIRKYFIVFLTGLIGLENINKVFLNVKTTESPIRVIIIPKIKLIEIDITLDKKFNPGNTDTMDM